ncbi:MAG: cupin domain-containing protein [Candidatus Lustribacter sp.]
MERFYDDLAAKNMDALWRARIPATSGSEPVAPYPPYRWDWSDIRPFMTRAGELVTPGPQSERRVVLLLHPALGAVRAASQLLTANVQMVLPGEVAPPHRHTIAAIRFIIEGESAVTFVDGEPVEMHPGDLVLTPAQHWHGHENHSSGPTLWMDTLDRPLTVAMRQARQESRPADGVMPAPPPSPVISPVLSYPWSDSQPALQRLADASTIDPFDDVVWDYKNPLTGGHVLPTIGCRMQMLRPKIRTGAHRHAYTSVYHVFRGSGSTIVDGVRIDWQAGDFFTIPPFAWHEHHNHANVPAYLFSVTDAPVIDALNFSLEDAYTENGGHQPVTGVYAGQNAGVAARA